MSVWIKSSRSSGDNDMCVEVLLTRTLVSVRDSKNADGPRFGVAPATWRAFLGTVAHRTDPAE